MQTTCPECGTTFRVYQTQLGLRRGLVRCGHCNAVFNAYDTLQPELEEAPPEQASPGTDSTVQTETDPLAQAEAQAAETEADQSTQAATHPELQTLEPESPQPAPTPEALPGSETGTGVEEPSEAEAETEEERPSPLYDLDVWDVENLPADPDLQEEILSAIEESVLAEAEAESQTHDPRKERVEDLVEDLGAALTTPEPTAHAAAEDDATAAPPLSPDEAQAEETEEAGEALDAEAPEPATEAAAPDPVTSDLPAEDSPDAILLSDLPTRRQDQGGGLPAWQKLLYGLALPLLLVSLLLQLAFFLRGELVATLPASRPLLEALCRPLDCVVPLPRQLDPKAIVSSSLEHDPEQVSRVRLTFLLANRTDQAQTWPHILLTLSDVRETPVASKALAPAAYLPPGVDARAGFPAQSEQEAQVELDIGSLAAASYVITPVYP